MAGPRAPIHLDAALLRRAEQRAAARGRPAGELIEEAVQRYLELDEGLERVRTSSRDDLSEAQALDLATRDVHATRAERQQP